MGYLLLRDRVLTNSPILGWTALPLRLAIGYGFVAHGWAKLSRGPDSFGQVLATLGVPLPDLAAWLTTIVELAGGAAVMTLATVRSHDQYNTTIYGLDDRYRGVYGQRRVLFMNEADMRDQGLAPGGWVDLTSCFEDEAPRSVANFLLVAYDIPRGCLAAYYPETNPLLPLSCVADGAGTPTSKAIPVVLSPSAEPPRESAGAR